jgi:putative serine/threonine protein kinase
MDVRTSCERSMYRSNSLFYDQYRYVICYPKFDVEEFKKRVKELECLRIESFEFMGEKLIHNVPVVGKGTVGIIVAACKEGKRVALKIRRRDADRSTMHHEAKMLTIANKVNLGPRFIAATENFLLMEFIEGLLLPLWVDSLEKDEASRRLRKVLSQVMEQAWILDQIGLDHGELSHAPKHIIVRETGHPVIIDFESASISRRVSNVTSISQFFYIGSSFAGLVQNKLEVCNTNKLLSALRVYKRRGDRSSFNAILRVLGFSSGV